MKTTIHFSGSLHNQFSKSIFSLFRYPLLLLVLLCYAASLNAQPDLYGMTSNCGQYGNGTIFRIKPDGSDFTVEYEFPAEHPEEHPGNLIQAHNGKLYGTASGGAKGWGVLFEYNPETGQYAKKYDFDLENGVYPNRQNMVLADNGKLYGTTLNGGVQGNYGVIFEYDATTGAYTKKYDFEGMNGAKPGALTKGPLGKLYGVAASGGCNSVGAIFEYDPETDVYTKKYDFDGLNNGYIFEGVLTLASNGKLYGTYAWGGANWMGFIYEYDPAANTFIIKFEFDKINGMYPRGTLLQAANGKLYGTSYKGGDNDTGVIFEYDPGTSECVKIFSFNTNTWSGSLIQVNGGGLYGMTDEGGSSGNGGIFEYNIETGAYIRKFDFDRAEGHPSANNLLQASNGKIFGTTANGGNYGAGVIFEFDAATNGYSKKIDFGSSNGAHPVSSLMQATNGNLYGMTSGGGNFDKGVIFEYDPVTKVFAKKIDFNGINGSAPQGALVQCTNGKLYGMAYGGSNTTGPGGGAGIIFEYDPQTGVFTKKIEFDYSNGNAPKGNLIQACNGKLYGTTTEGGLGSGVLFEYDPWTNTFTGKHNFDGIDGRYPYGSLVQAYDGKLYGMTYSGGYAGGGVLFEYNPETGVFNKIFDLQDTSYECFAVPFGNLVQTSDGKLYGMTTGSCLSDYSGALFEYDPATKILAKKFDFDGMNGAHPRGSLIVAANGKLYGMTAYGGEGDAGVIFEFNPLNNVYTKLKDFSATDGCYPYKDLTEVFPANDVTQTVQDLEIFPNPSPDRVNLRLKGYGGKIMDLSVFNALGQVIWQYPSGIITKPELCLDLSGNPSGIYFVRARVGEKVVSKPLILVAQSR